VSCCPCFLPPWPLRGRRRSSRVLPPSLVPSGLARRSVLPPAVVCSLPCACSVAHLAARFARGVCAPFFLDFSCFSRRFSRFPLAFVPFFAYNTVVRPLSLCPCLRGVPWCFLSSAGLRFSRSSSRCRLFSACVVSGARLSACASARSLSARVVLGRSRLRRRVSGCSSGPFAASAGARLCSLSFRPSGRVSCLVSSLARCSFCSSACPAVCLPSCRLAASASRSLLCYHLPSHLTTHP